MRIGWRKAVLECRSMPEQDGATPLTRATRRAAQSARGAWEGVRKTAGAAVAAERPVEGASEERVETPAEPVTLSSEESLLFRPGDGQMPLHVAGRGHEMAVLRAVLNPLRRKESPPYNAAVHGMRGLGKSVLLEWMAQAAAVAGLRPVFVSSSELPDLDALYAVTLGKRLPNAELSLQEDSGQFGARGTHTAAKNMRQEHYAGMTPEAWRAKLTESCLETPVLMLVDEAHVLEADVARILLNASQLVRRSAPFALVLAGTPDLKRHLSFAARRGPGPAGAKSSFWERLGPGDLRLGLLSTQDAENALRIPLETSPHGLPYDREAVSKMADQSDGYPYFVQMWGGQAEIAARKGSGRVDAQAVKAAGKRVAEMRRNFYDLRMDELDELGLLSAARHLAPLLNKPGQEIGRNQARATLAGALPEGADPKRALTDLLHLGALDAAKGVAVRAGIPSFMQHLQDSVAPLGE